ncbi:MULTISPECIES: cytochrome P450 [Streptomyces]|uniref:Cytochrome P450 n=1 Tax=Streptomyces doudnae TaxID=3075536 RepID=A0ABD5EVI5_9ACTN|nr:MULTISPECIES: cytochrome P450 [unclassified Streptomyces]MDT0438207.1 cytochrome P450 [Streptomyces sp. DSM 41981]MYQ64582.1 cytochrome P450 [Streptomyces sp. SID4950]SCD81979.1 mycocyclosin synthase [Streptomyces sp. SolWspMP-5a-2]
MSSPTTKCPYPAGEYAPVAWPLSRRGDVVPAECGQLRAASPIARVKTLTGDDAWLVTSHALARQVLDDGTHFSLRETAAEGRPRQYALTIPPEAVNTMGNVNSAGLHQEVLRAFGPRSGPASAEWMRERAHELIDGMVAEGAPVDLRQRFAEPYAAVMVSEVLGLPHEDGCRLMAGLDLGFVTSPEAFDGCTANWDKDFAYVLRRVRGDHASRRGLIRRLCELRDDPDRDGADLTDEMIAAVVTSLFGAGAMSTYVFLLHAVLTLVRHPEAMERLRARPELMPRAVEELMRCTLSIGDGLPRIALADVRVGEVDVRAGELVLVCVEGANFDPEAFEDPERFDIDRSPNPHLSFGSGPHFCPASAISRVHAGEALTALLDRLPKLRLALPADQLVWRTGNIKRVPERLHVLW